MNRIARLFHIGARSFTCKDIGLAFFIALAIFGLSTAWRNCSSAGGVDFYQFWVVGHALPESDITNIYSDADRARLGGEYFEKARLNGAPRQLAVAGFRQKLETYSSPFLYSVLRLFSTRDYETDWRNYRIFLLVCFVSSVIALSRLLNYSWIATFAAVAVFSTWFQPFTSDLRTGNVNSIQLAALTAFLWVATRMRWRHRDILGGLILGLAVSFKPNLVFVPGAIAVAWILHGRIRRLWPFFVGVAVAAAIVFAITAANFPAARCWSDWMSALQNIPAGIIPIQSGNFAPAQILFELFDVAAGFWLAVIFGILAGTSLWLHRMYPFQESPSALQSSGAPETLALALGCLLVVLIPTLAWQHYFVLTIPAFLLLWNPFGSKSPSTLLRRILVVVALFGIAYDPVSHIFPPSPLLCDYLAVGGTLILLLLAIWPPDMLPRLFFSDKNR